METIQVEFNNKLQEYQKAESTMTDAVRQLKEKELSDLQNRIREFQQVAQQDIQKKEAELMEPIQKLVFSTIEEYAKAKGYDMVIDISQNATMLYYSPKADHTEAIIAELKKKENK